MPFFCMKRKPLVWFVYLPFLIFPIVGIGLHNNRITSIGRWTMASGKGLRDNLVRDPLLQRGVRSSAEKRVVEHHSDFELYLVPGS